MFFKKTKQKTQFYYGLFTFSFNKKKSEEREEEFYIMLNKKCIIYANVSSIRYRPFAYLCYNSR